MTLGHLVFAWHVLLITWRSGFFMRQEGSGARVVPA
jgi:hypothetical protein